MRSLQEASGEHGMRWFVRGDVDGFFGLALDNLVQLLVIDALCRTVLGFPDALIYGRVLPAAAVSLLVGNIYYARQAMRLARATGRRDVCALPYGINTVSLFAFVFLVMLPAKLAAEAAGAEDPAAVAWRAGLVACLGSGLIEIGGSFVAERIRRATPRAALLSTLAAIALGFISLGFFFRTYARPVIGLTTFGIILLVYFGRVRFRGGLPGGLVAVAVGTAVAWMGGIAPVGEAPFSHLGLHIPVPVLGDLVAALMGGQWVGYLSVIIPMGVFSVFGSLQNIESAEAAGDSYPTRPSLAVNGVGTVAGALFGSCFPTTIYIGHPGWKAMGARAGYSVLNAGFFTLALSTGTLGAIVWAVPVDAALAIVLWIGIVITAQAFQSTPREHAPAAVVGLLPGVAAWGALMAKNGLRAAGAGTPGGPPFSEALIGAFRGSGTWIHGAFALEQGFILTSMVLSAATVAIIGRRFATAGLWCAVASLLAAAGLIHSYRWTVADTAGSLTPGWPWAAGYAIMSLCFFVARWVTVPVEDNSR
jgi:AGZA family xanthine/uracil permease-like MFS transporter